MCPFFCLPHRWVWWHAHHRCNGGPVLPASHHLHHHHPLHAQVRLILFRCSILALRVKMSLLPWQRLTCQRAKQKQTERVYVCMHGYARCITTPLFPPPDLRNTNRMEAIWILLDWAMADQMKQVSHSDVQHVHGQFLGKYKTACPKLFQVYCFP